MVIAIPVKFIFHISEFYFIMNVSLVISIQYNFSANIIALSLAVKNLLSSWKYRRIYIQKQRKKIMLEL